MAEPPLHGEPRASRFDTRAFESRLATEWLGRRLIALGATTSTNDAAWEALATGAADGTAVVADEQSQGRGRSGRAWHTAPGKGLALSVLLHRAVERRPLGLIPLAAGLALARGLEQLGVEARLKWPNDLLLGDRKLAGILAESRSGSARGRTGPAAVVIGVGVNVAEGAGDFPPPLAASNLEPVPRSATSLALAGFAIAREAVAAEFLNALEPLWLSLGSEGGTPFVRAWRERAAFWGKRVRVRTSAGWVAGVARDVDPGGGLMLELPEGALTTIVAGDLEVETAGDPSRR